MKTESRCVSRVLIEDIDHNDWTQYDADGHVAARAISVYGYGDGTVRINDCLYPAGELTASADRKRIDHVGGAWYLTR